MTTPEQALSPLLPRHAEELVRSALTDTRVVLVNGARQVGKSTLARLVLRGAPAAMERRLDDPAVLSAARADPVGFLRHDGLLLVDEVQRAPELFLPLKDAVDVDQRPGRFLLTGSAQVLGLQGLPDALPGRLEAVELWPLAQGEIDGAPDGFVDAAFQAGPELDHTSILTRPGYVSRIVRGGYPEAVARPDPRRRSRFFQSYLGTLIERDVRQLAEIERGTDLRRLVGAMAARAGSLLVLDALARDVGLPPRTTARYVDLLEAVFLVRRVPAWSTNHTQRAVGTPKLAVTDSGVCAAVLGLDQARLSDPTAPLGMLLENFVLMELARQLTWAYEPVRLFHYRTRDGVEVDAVLERASGEVVGVEVKSSATIGAQDFRGLRHLRDRVGDRFVAGLLLYTGGQTLPFGDRLRALPLSALWELPL